MMKNNFQRRSGFTLIEMTVAVAILLTILTIVLVPLRLGLDSFALGRARTETQGAIGATIADIERDLRRAVKVFPNSELAGVIERGPYFRSNVPPATALDSASPADPSYEFDEAAACNSAGSAKKPDSERISNPSRIDMILAARDGSGNLESPVKAGDTLVSYYSRRLDMDKAYDPIDNPVVLFRAEMPFRYNNANVTVDGNANLRLDNSRFPADDAACSANLNRETLWMAHNYYGEANLENIARPPASSTVLPVGVDTGSHSLAIPRGLGLVVTNAGCSEDPCQPGLTGQPLSLIPESTFSTFDTNSDGKIDRVNISLSLTTFDAVSNNRLRNNQPVGQQLRASRSVDLPNIR